MIRVSHVSIIAYDYMKADIGQPDLDSVFESNDTK